MKIFLSCIFIFLFNVSVYAESYGAVTGLKIPRFVSLKTDSSNLRVGPGLDYPKKIHYIKKNLPVEIVDEHLNWRKIIDSDQNEGWMHKRLLKGNRFALIDVSYSEGAQIQNFPQGNVIGKIGNANIVKLNKCLKKWCHISISKNKGWILKINLWGVYEDEIFNLPFYQPIISWFWKNKIVIKILNKI